MASIYPFGGSAVASSSALATQVHLIDNNHNEPDTPEEDEPLKKSSKKKKANRACLHCQKAHLTCEDARPCKRCVRRGMGDMCIEGHRKKAKYLMDDEEFETPSRNEDQPMASPPVQSAMGDTTPVFAPTSEALFDISGFDPTYNFGSESAGLEYNMLSSILGNISPQESTLDGADPGSTLGTAWPLDMMADGQTTNTGADMSAGNGGTATDLSDSPSFGYLGSTQPAVPMLGTTSFPSASAFSVPYPPAPGPQTYTMPNTQRSIPASPSASISSPGAFSISEMDAASQASEIYRTVNKPYGYTEAWHFLMKHLKEKYEKNDILRIVRALSVFRPSLIALQMPLSQEDEVFVERSFQRSLLELDKLIRFSGTPTVIWRRTGEICLVGAEFVMLTEWSAEELVGQRKFIYELFESQSAVEYWEQFAAHAFENTTQAVYSHCVLRKPNGDPVSCSFCFSIRRDIFDLPSIIIGQWLPLL